MLNWSEYGDFRSFLSRVISRPGVAVAKAASAPGWR